MTAVATVIPGVLCVGAPTTADRRSALSERRQLG
jgi:hypothetical protein